MGIDHRLDEPTMRPQFEFRSLHLNGLAEADQENPSTDAIAHLLKERTRVYNRMGSEGWSLVAEHLEVQTYSAIATFSRPNDTAGDGAADLPGLSSRPSSAAYPTLQPDPAAPNSFRLVWEK